MSLNTITVDVYAHWSEKPPVYRVFVDDELLTERTFLWGGSSIFIREHMEVNLKPDVTHTLKVEKISGNGNIQTKNITLNGQAVTDPSGNFVVTE
jgi:hypothetical protein